LELVVRLQNEAPTPMAKSQAQAIARSKSRTLPSRPVTFRLPKPGVPDPFFGFSRAFYYEGQKRGYWKFVRICAENKQRGVTLIPFSAVERFVRGQMES
jgi:hypothetical protein